MKCQKCQLEVKHIFMDCSSGTIHQCNIGLCEPCLKQWLAFEAESKDKVLAAIKENLKQQFALQERELELEDDYNTLRRTALKRFLESNEYNTNQPH